ncbi:HAMP domain-containing histidine kinase [Candidatus Woesearchaeota archaeon]|nr:HAMP domain-containing histidine kinase [Candidatus Woesearchaeota archaeon]
MTPKKVVKHDKKKCEDEYKKLENKYDRLRKLDNYKNNFIAKVVHDLRNPLTSVQGYIDYILSERFGKLKPKQKKALIHSKEGLGNLKKLIEKILLLHKLQTHKEKPEIKIVNLKHLLSSVYKQEKSLFYDKPKVKLVLDVQKNLPEVYGDHEMIRQVLLNLVGNAYKFTDRGAVIISAKKKDAEHVEIAINDTGKGMSDKEQRNLFKQFTQISEESRKKYGGLGLGLVIVKELLKLNKSKISVISIPEKGSVFSFRLRIKK